MRPVSLSLEFSEPMINLVGFGLSPNFYQPTVLERPLPVRFISIVALLLLPCCEIGNFLKVESSAYPADPDIWSALLESRG